MHNIFLALGSNLGDRLENIKKAIDLLNSEVRISKSALIYESRAVGFKEQPNFLNTVVGGETNFPPDDLLVFLKEVEKNVGRTKSVHWGPREIDIDILFYDDLIFKNETLEIPHPQIASRDFVLVPMNDIASDFIHPIFRKTIKQLLEEFPDSTKSILAQISFS